MKPDLLYVTTWSHRITSVLITSLHPLIPKCRILSSSLGSALLTCFFLFGRILLSSVLESIPSCSTSLYLNPKRSSLNTAVFIWIKMKTNTLMAHKSRYCLDIFLCLHIVNNSCCFSLFLFDTMLLRYFRHCFLFYATIVRELPQECYIYSM